MDTRRRRTVALLAAAALGVASIAGCRFGGPALEPRYFSAAEALAEELGGAAQDDPRVHLVALRPTRAAGHLRERMVWRNGAGEVGFREDRRWTEPPVELLRRALELAVVGAPGLAAAPGSADQSLAVTLEAFGELRGDGTRAAEVELVAVLSERGGRVLLRRRFSEVVPVPSDDAAALARALGQGLGRQLAALCAAVEGTLDEGGVARAPAD